MDSAGLPRGLSAPAVTHDSLEKARQEHVSRSYFGAVAGTGTERHEWAANGFGHTTEGPSVTDRTERLLEEFGLEARQVALPTDIEDENRSLAAFVAGGEDDE